MTPVGETPAYCGIRIDKEGIWHYEGREMFRKDIVKYFYDHLQRDGDGRYYIQIDDDIGYILVEDVPYVVKAVYWQDREGREEVLLSLSDGTMETLDPATVYVGWENVLYCLVKNGVFTARFSRPSYYQLASKIQRDRQGRFYLILNGERFYIQNKEVE